MRMPNPAAEENHRKMAADDNAVTPRIAKLAAKASSCMGLEPPIGSTRPQKHAKPALSELKIDEIDFFKNANKHDVVEKHHGCRDRGQGPAATIAAKRGHGERRNIDAPE